MKLNTAERQNIKLRIGIAGASGFGKTYSAIKMASGMVDDIAKVAIIDTENGSSHLYADLGPFNILSLEAPFSPERYIQAIEICENAGMEVLVLDNISCCWEFLLDFHSSLPGNSFTNWVKVKPKQKLFVDKMLQSSCHIIATMRTKQAYVLNQKEGKYAPEKVGLKPIQSDGINYEMTLCFDINIKHLAKASKDRTGLFMDKPEFVINSETGRKLKDFANSPSNKPMEEKTNSHNIQGSADTELPLVPTYK